MSDDRVIQQILIGSEAAGKTYQFDEAHNRTQPAQMWFQESHEGEILFVVFYSQACRWSRCLGCNLPSLMSREHVDYQSLIAQINHVFADPQVIERRESIRKVIVSNNGSILDEQTFSSTALIYLLAQLNLNLPRLSVLSLETRPEYVDIAELEFISRVLAEGDTPTQLEIAIGFEAFDDTIRNEVFQKGMTLETFESLVRKMAPYDFHLKCYFMQKPVPEMTDAEAVADIQRGIEYLESHRLGPRSDGQHAPQSNLCRRRYGVGTGLSRRSVCSPAFARRRRGRPARTRQTGDGLCRIEHGRTGARRRVSHS